MPLQQAILTVTTASNGAGSAQTGNARGVLHALRYIKNNFADGIDFTVTVVNSATTDTLLTGTDVNASASFAPRMDRCTVAAVAASANDVPIPFVGALKVTVAQGGDAKSGTFVLYWDDME